MSTTTSSNVAPAILESRRKVKESADFIRAKINVVPATGMILGTGLGALADQLEDAVSIAYDDIPHFPVCTAPSHHGALVVGKMQGKPVVIMKGRFHTYEGYSQQEVVFPIRVMKELGIDTLVVTCATGGLNFKFKAGDIMLIVDHINLTGSNPLIGPNDPDIGERFPVMFDAYRPELRELAHKVALKEGLRLQEGVYAGITGPAYFTRAELRFLIKIGADTIGMSTVPEVIAATHAGIKVLGVGVISDMALPDGAHATEEEIIACSREVGPKVQRLLRGILAEL